MQGLLSIMMKTSIRRLSWVPWLVGIVVWVGLPAASLSANQATVADGGADLIVIDVLKAHGPLERPAVKFYHDKHTEALAKQGKDCQTCHQEEQGNLNLAFGRTADMPKDKAMDLFHDRCIACHVESGASSDTPAGPVSCGGCHVKDQDAVSIWAPIDLDKGLHYLHVQANDDQCGQCHHEYNQQTRKLVYVKGQEGACVYCHKEHAEDDRISISDASHLACVGCHRRRTLAGETAGPIQCAGCHDPRQQALIQRPKDVPRIQRNQPDTVLVKSMAPGSPPIDVDSMDQVPFDHKAHEGYTDTCKGCHHAGLQSCVQCHPIQGDTEGGQVKLAQAMHQDDATMSCIGCHNRQKEQTQCIGCHQSMPPTHTLTASTACRTCHSAAQTRDEVAMVPKQSAQVAARLLSARQAVRGTIPPDQIPDTVVIKSLVQSYAAVEMPHRRMVLALAKAIQGNDLAAYFHKDPLTLCQGCHHNSPESIEPPRCISCHGESSDPLNLSRPGLKAAYHQMCLGCHEAMDIKEPASRDCAACHAKRD